MEAEVLIPITDLIDNMPVPRTDEALGMLALELGHGLLGFGDEDRVRALDEACSHLRHVLMAEGRSLVDAMLDAQAVRSAVHGEIARLEAQRQRKQRGEKR
jgi:hypothetical protein